MKIKNFYYPYLIDDQDFAAAVVGDPVGDCGGPLGRPGVACDQY